MSIDHFFLREFESETQIRHYCYCARLIVFNFKSCKCLYERLGGVRTASYRTKEVMRLYGKSDVLAF